MATELLLDNPLGELLYGDVNQIDSNDDAMRPNTAMFETVKLLNGLAGFGYTGAQPGDGTSNVSDAFQLMKDIPFLYSAAIYLNNELMPNNTAVIMLEDFLHSLPVVGSDVLPMLAPDQTQGEFGGDALGAGVTLLKSFPLLEGPVTDVIENLHNDPLLADQVTVLTSFLHNFSFAGNLLSGNVPESSLLASQGADGDAFGLVVGFAQSVPVVGDIVSTVIPDVFPGALGGDVQALAAALHTLTPGYQVVDALIGSEGAVSGLLSGDFSGVLGLTDMLTDAAPELGGLLGGTGLISTSTDSDGMAQLSVLGLVDIGMSSSLSLDNLIPSFG